jgi:hypothetical protein
MSGRVNYGTLVVRRSVPTKAVRVALEDFSN